MQNLIIRKENHIAEIVLERQPVNALNEELVSELNEAFHEMEADKEVRVLIIRSALSCFVAGADIKMMLDIQRNHETMRMLTYCKKLQNAYSFLENMSKPSIAYINGHAMGGGLELALACDFRIMTSGKARIGLPEVRLGMIPGAGGTQRLTRLLGETKAKEIIYFGKQLSAEEAYQYGLVSRVVESVDGIDEVYKMAHQLALQAPIALAGIKRCIQASSRNPLNFGLETEMVETANVFTSNDSKTGFKAFLEKKTPAFEGC